MTIYRSKVGRGMLQTTGISWDDTCDETDPEIARVINASSLEGLLRQVEEDCAKVLSEASLPNDHGCWLYNKVGKWTYFRSDLLKDGWSIANEVWPIARARGYELESSVGFAARMLGCVTWIRRLTQTGKYERAALYAHHLGVLRTSQRLLRDQGSIWDVGTESKAHRKNGGAATRKRSDEERVRVWLRYMRETGGKKTESDRLAAEELGDGETTVRRARTVWEKGAIASD